jgi:ATP-dependent Lon protease
MQIMEYLSKSLAHKNAVGRCIGLVGPPGIAKTSIARALSSVIGIPMVSINLGGSSDSSEILGHSFTYEGSQMGRIARGIIESGVMNPIFLFDEIDKIAEDRRGIADTLIHITDQTQNTTITDRYFDPLPFDLSRSLMIFTMNDTRLVNPILLNRMTIVRMTGYDKKEKLTILKQFTFPKFLQAFGRTPEDVVIPEPIWNTLLSDYTEPEDGMRLAQDTLHTLLSRIHLATISRDFNWPELTYPVHVTLELVHKLLDSKKKTDVFSHIYL